MLDRLNTVLAGRYTVERELGRGGMASVWLARDLRHDRPVAIKVLRAELAGAIGVDRFLREIRLTAKLQHPHIVPVLDSGVLPGPDGAELPWYAMTYVPGESLRARLERERFLPVDEALRIVECAGEALHAAHREGIVHRDIKPENLLLAGGQVYVADFGIAKALVETGGERLTSTGLAIGTPVYMSPEQASAQPVDARSDEYSLASVLYEMLTGEPPFTGPTAQAIVARRLAEPARAIRPVRPAVLPSIETAVLRALERVPADRFPDVAAFADALRHPTVPTAAAPKSVRRAPRVMAGVLMLAVIALGAWWLGRGRNAARVARDPGAVALYQRGVHELNKRTPAGAVEAVRALGAAVGRDSTYTEAWAALARTYVRVYGRGFGLPGVPDDSVIRLAVAASDRALAGDRRSAEAWKTQAIVSRVVDPTDNAPALRALRQAGALDPTDAESWMLLGTSTAETGDMAGAIAAWHRGVTAGPSNPEALAFLGLGYYWRRQYDSAARWADSSMAVDPNFLLARTTIGSIAVERRDFRRARAAFDAAARLTTGVEEINALAGAALVEARAGAPAKSRGLLARAESLFAGRPRPSSHTAVYMAEAYAGLGDADHAVGWLEQYQPVNDLHFQLHLRCDASLDPIGDDRRFRAMLLKSRAVPPNGC